MALSVARGGLIDDDATALLLGAPSKRRIHNQGKFKGKELQEGLNNQDKFKERTEAKDKLKSGYWL